jgi:hypothetical protein
MAILSKVGIASGSLIQAAQITQIIDALTASGSVIDILVTGSVNVEGPTRLGTLGENSRSPLIFNPDTSGESVFYVKNPSGALTIGTGENPYLGGDLMTLSPLGALGLNGNLTVGNNTIVNGNLGVGTTNPLARLTVSNNGSQSIEMDYSAVLNANYIESYNRSSSAPLDLVYYISPGPTGSHRFYTNGGQRMVINRDGAVGINNATPVGALDVVGTTIMRGGDLIISSSYPRLYLTDTDSNSDFSIINDNGALNIYDDTNGASRIFILPNGNVGIGGASTGAKLDVNGNITVSGSVGIGTTSPLYKLSSHDSSAGRVIVGNFSNDTNAGSTEVGIRLAHNNSDLVSVNLISQRVGANAGADFSIELANSAGTPTERFRITEGGNVGIGTTNPLAKLTVSNNGSQSIYMDYAPGVNANVIESFNTATQTPLDMVYFLATGATGSHRFYTNGSQKMVINRDGNVGIGTTTPTSLLDVNGNMTVSGSTTLFNNEGTLNLRGTNSTLVLLYPDNNTRRAYFGFSPSLTGTIILENEYLTGNRNIALVTNGGFVGINKYVPTVALDVNGNTLITGSLTATGATTIGTTLTTGGKLGYADSVGGIIDQLISRNTAVTLNTACGRIRAFSGAGNLSVYNRFTVNNNNVNQVDVIILNVQASSNKYRAEVTRVQAGSFEISYISTLGTATDQPIFSFAVIKAGSTQSFPGGGEGL